MRVTALLLGFLPRMQGSLALMDQTQNVSTRGNHFDLFSHWKRNVFTQSRPSVNHPACTNIRLYFAHHVLKETLEKCGLPKYLKCLVTALECVVSRLKIIWSLNQTSGGFLYCFFILLPYSVSCFLFHGKKKFFSLAT